MAGSSCDAIISANAKRINERCSGLFTNLCALPVFPINSLWPLLLPLMDHGDVVDDDASPMDWDW